MFRYLLLALCCSIAWPQERTVAVSPFDRSIPQVAIGGGWQTAISILNMDASAVSFRIVFRTPEGAAWSVPIESRGTASEFPITLQSGQSVTLVSGNLAGLEQGWARLVVPCCFDLSGFAVFRQSVAGRPDFEAVVPFSRSNTASYLLFDNAQGFATGIAMANGLPDIRSLATMRVRDESGNVIASRDVDLPPDGRTVFVLADLLPQTGGRKGSIEIQSAAGLFTVLGLRFNPGGAFTSFTSFEPR